jgi:precorrin-6Y C5,15-methyltransferase (decarboxylating)
VDVVVGAAPAALAGLPDPDRVFVGGGGPDVLAACWDRLRPAGRLVATFVVLDRALAAFHLLGSMVQVHVDRCVPIGGAGVRLEPLNPVFVCWGDKP